MYCFSLSDKLIGNLDYVKMYKEEKCIAAMSHSEITAIHVPLTAELYFLFFIFFSELYF